MNIGTHTSIPVSPSRSTARLCGGATAPAGVGANHADLLLVGILDERHAVTAEVTELLAGCTPRTADAVTRSTGEGPGRPTVALQIRTRAFVDENYPALVHVEWDHENGRCCRTHSTAMFGGNYAATSDSRLPRDRRPLRLSPSERPPHPRPHRNTECPGPAPPHGGVELHPDENARSTVGKSEISHQIRC